MVFLHPQIPHLWFTKYNSNCTFTANEVPLFNKQNRVAGKPLCSWQNEIAPDGIEVSAESVCVR
nr:MAG TPA: hypothetical protein [Caudoviricetes sp.]